MTAKRAFIGDSSAKLQGPHRRTDIGILGTVSSRTRDSQKDGCYRQSGCLVKRADVRARALADRIIHPRTATPCCSEYPVATPSRISTREAILASSRSDDRRSPARRVRGVFRFDTHSRYYPRHMIYGLQDRSSMGRKIRNEYARYSVVHKRNRECGIAAPAR